jgi:hypothetical protein
MRVRAVLLAASAMLYGCSRTQDPADPFPASPSASTLARLPDSTLEESLYEWLLQRVSLEDSCFERDREIVSRLPSGYLDLYATHVVEETLEEDGIDALLGGADRRLVPDAIRAYRRFGALHHARRLQEAMRKERHARSRAPRFEAEQAQAVHLPDPPMLGEDAALLRRRWVRRHLRRFSP